MAKLIQTANRILPAFLPAADKHRWRYALPGLALWFLLASRAGFGTPLGGNDSYMRVVRLWQVIAQGGWAKGFVSRDGAPFGYFLHWTMPYDLVVLAFAAPLAPFIGWHEAVRYAAPFGAMITGAMLILAVCWAISPGGKAPATALAGILVACAPVVIAFGHYGRSTHNLLILTSWVVVGGAGWRFLRPDAQSRDGVVLGLASGFAIWVALESVPPAICAASIVAVLTALWPEQRHKAAITFAAVFPSTVGVALLLDPPPRFATVDRLSLLYLLVSGLFAVIAILPLTPILRRRPPATRLSVNAVAALGVGALSMTLFWWGWDSTLSFSDPAVGRFFWAHLSDTQPPAWPGDFFFYLGPAILGFGFGLWLVWTDSIRRVAWAFLLVCLAVLSVIGARYGRLCLYPATLGAMLSAAGIGRLFERDDVLIWRRLVRVGLTVVTATAPLLAVAANRSPPSIPLRCSVKEAASTIERLGPPDAIVLADANLSPALLYYGDRLRTVSGPYHVNTRGLVYLAHAEKAPDPTALHNILRKRHVGFLLFCTHGSGWNGPERRKLMAGDAPPWLRRIPLHDSDSADLVLYRVVPNPR